jgi:hypothetical protein
MWFRSVSTFDYSTLYKNDCFYTIHILKRIRMMPIIFLQEIYECLLSVLFSINTLPKRGHKCQTRDYHDNNSK